MTTTTNTVWNGAHFDVLLNTAVGKQFDAKAVRIMKTTPGVAQTQPMLTNAVKFEGDDATVTGFMQQPLFEQEMIDGRWYTPAEAASGAHVAVIAKNLARTSGAAVGDTVTLQTATGPASSRIIGITSSQWNNGVNFYVPLQTLKTILDTDTVNGYFVAMSSIDHGAIDRTTTQLEDRLSANDYAVGTMVKYSSQEQNVKANQRISSAIAILGLLVVAISMVGLINAITMSVLGRTREIGVLRCIGARARDIRRIFTAEGIAVSLAGWFVGIPIGYALARMFIWLLLKIVKLEFAFTFPPVNLLIALGGTLLLALVIIRIPLRRAVRFKPGEAIRYA